MAQDGWKEALFYYICTMNRLFVALFLLTVASYAAYAQQNNWHTYYDDLMSERQEDMESAESEEIEDRLGTIAADPFNINAITRKDLEEIYFLSSSQIESVLDYVHQYGPVMSKSELMMIPYLDDARRNLLSCLTYIGKPSTKAGTFLDSLKYEKAKQEYESQRKKEQSGLFVAYMSIPFYTRQGYENGSYLGSKYTHWLRFNYKFSSHVKLAINAAQDAGEPFFANKNKWGYDYYSGFLQVQKIGVLGNLIVGHFRMKTGLGLILNNDISFGKTLGMNTVHLSNTIARPHNSRTASDYLQGAVVTLDVAKNADLTVFGSYRKIDVTLTDSLSIRTIVKTGYHRTASELARKYDASQTTAGANLRYTFYGFELGVTGLYNHYNLLLTPYSEGSSDAQLYRMFYPRGQDFWNFSVNYGYKLGKLLRIEGETATGDCGRVATINTISWRVCKTLELAAIYRYYPVQFTATMGKSFSEGGLNQDENGIYLSAMWTPSQRFSLQAYTDFAYFQWPKYLATGSSHSFDNFVQVKYSLTPHSSLMAKYRIKLRQRNTGTAGELKYREDHHMRVTYNVDIQRLTLRSQFDGEYCNFTDKSAGFMLSQWAKYNFSFLSLSLGLGYFDTKDYNSHVLLSEWSLPNTSSSKTFYGEGLRSFAIVETHYKRWSLLAKWGLTHYFDRKTIGSGQQLINSSTQTDLSLMLRWQM